MRRRRPCFWCVLAAFVVSAAVWTIYFPYDPLRVRRAIPWSAAVVVEHDGRAGSWRNFLHHPLIRQAASPTSGDAQPIGPLLDSIEASAGRFVRGKLVLGYVPLYAGTGAPAWVAASWAGSHAQWFRWGLYPLFMSGFSRVSLARSPPFWVTDLGPNAPGMKLSVAASEGVMLACISTDGWGVRHLIRRVESAAPIVSELDGPDRGAPPGDSAARFWIRPPADGEEGVGTRTWSGTITAANRRKIEGWARREASGNAAEPASTERGRDALLAMQCSGFGRLAQVLAEKPCAIALVSGRPLRSREPWGAGLDAIRQSVRAGVATNAPVLACVLDGEHAGRMLGLKVPSLLVGAQAREETDVRDLARNILDDLNRRYGWGLIPRVKWAGGDGPDGAGGSVPMVVVDSTRDGLYSSLAEDERATFARLGDWVLVASNARIMSDILAASNETNGWRHAASGVTRSGAASHWLRGLVDRRATAYACVDLEASNRALVNAMAVYALALTVRDREQSMPTRRWLGWAAAAADRLRGLGQWRAWATETRDGLRVEFEIGGD
jgi:hypothetical protein